MCRLSRWPKAAEPREIQGGGEGNCPSTDDLWERDVTGEGRWEESSASSERKRLG